MRIYFSGGVGIGANPEDLIPAHLPNIMLTFYDMDKKVVRDRTKIFLANHENKPRRLSKPAQHGQAGLKRKP